MYKTVFTWLKFVKSIFDECDFSEAWNVQQKVNLNFLKCNVNSVFRTSSFKNGLRIWIIRQGCFYAQFKNQIMLEPYLLRLKGDHQIYICELRTLNDRWWNIPRDERKYHICMTGLGDEFHYICFSYNVIVKRLRKTFIPDYYVKYPHVSKMYSML